MKNFSDRQLQIINAAIGLIAEKGIQKLTIKNLSQKIGTAEGAIYRHFESKINILLGILEFFKEDKENSLSEMHTNNVSATVKLRNLFQRRFNYFAENPAIAAVIFSEEIFQNDKRLSEEVFRIMENSRNTITQILKKGAEKGEIRNDISAEELATIITGALRLTVTRWRLSGYSFDLIKEGNKLWDSINKIVTK